MAHAMSCLEKVLMLASFATWLHSICWHNLSRHAPAHIVTGEQFDFLFCFHSTGVMVLLLASFVNLLASLPEWHLQALLC